MNILHISALPIWPLGGKGGMPSLAETLRGHRRGGHKITLILPRYGLFDDEKDRIEAPADTPYEVHIAPCRWLPAVKFLRRTVKRIFRSNELPFAFRWFINITIFVFFTVSMFFTAIKVKYRTGEKFDLVYAHNQNASLAGLLLRFYFRIPNVTRLYGTFLADLMNRRLVWLRYPVAAAGYLVPSSLLICGNDGTRGDEVARKLKIKPERFRFWQNGIDPPKSPPTVNRDEFIRAHPSGPLRAESTWICSCSRLSYWKRVDRIFEAVHFCKQSGQDCQLLLAGDGPERGNLEALAQKLGLDQEIVWLGAVPHDDIWAVMNLADIFIITNDVTNRCNPLYEAIYAGLPVVSVRDPSTGDLLIHEENALLADRGQPEQLGQNVLRLCQTPSLRDKMRQAQKARSKTFWSWDERLECEVRDLENLLKKCHRTKRRNDRAGEDG